MPNHCQNYLNIEGKSKDINKLMKQVQILKEEATEQHEETIFSCHKVIPRPTSEDSNWYNWNIDNWGSKWDIYNVEEFGEWEEGHWGISFSTAWSPVIPVIDKLAKQHKKLTITYSFYETGNDFMGHFVYSKGNRIEELDSSISEASCEDIELVMGGSFHHYCLKCYEGIECIGEDTTKLCESCSTEIKEEEEQLWETEQDNGSNLLSTGTNN